MINIEALRKGQEGDFPISSYLETTLGDVFIGQVLNKASVLSTSLGDKQIKTTHILSALIDSSELQEALELENITIDTIRTNLSNKGIESREKPGKKGLSAQAEEALRIAGIWSYHSQTPLACSNLLIGIISSGVNDVSQVLIHAGVDMDVLRKHLSSAPSKRE